MRCSPKVVIDRNKMISLMVEQLKDPGRILLNGTPEDWRPWAEHFANMYRELEEKAKIKKYAGKEKLNVSQYLVLAGLCGELHAKSVSPKPTKNIK